MAQWDENRAIARQGIATMLTKGVKEACDLLYQHRGKSVQIDGSLAIVKVVQCLLTWDEGVIDEADDFVKEIEKRCEESYVPPTSPSSRQLMFIMQVSGADCSLLRALLSFTRMSLSAYVKAGIMLRAASKVYQKVHEDVEKERKVDPSALEDVRAAYSLGYGVVNVALSLLPESVLSIMKLLGFSGDRIVGRRALEFVSESDDMKAPFAVLALLTYHVVIRPSLNVDVVDKDWQDSIHQADTLLGSADAKYPNAPLFQYFRGRVAYLKHDTHAALEAFQAASALSKSQPEVSYLCYYEMGFLSAVILQWDQCAMYFSQLLEESHWSPGIYSYLSGVAKGAAGSVAEAQESFRQIPSLVKQKNSPFEKMVLKKGAVYMQRPITQAAARVALLEMAFVWNYLSWCSPTQHRAIVQLLQDEHQSLQNNVYAWSASLLVQGASLLFVDELDNAETCLRKVLHNAEELVNQSESQVAAFATFEIGLLYVKRGEVNKARNAFNKAKSLYSNYELESQMHTKIKGALESLTAKA